MEVTTLGYLFWFCIILLVLSSLKSARKQFLISLMSGISFIVLGLCFVAPIHYVAPFSISDYYYIMDEPHIPYMQQTVGSMFCFFGLGLIVNTLFQVTSGDDEEKGHGGLLERGTIR